MSYLLTLVLLFGQTGAETSAADSSAPAAEAAATAETAPAQKADAGDSKSAAAPSKPASDEPAADQASETTGSGIGGTVSDIFNSGALGLMWRGGVFMWPILLCGILAAGVIIERYRSLKMLTTDTSALRTQVRELLHADRIEEALHLCEREQGPVPAILSAGIRKYLVLRHLNYDAGRIEEQVVKAMDDYSVHVVAALEKHLPILATVSSAAPTLGFLGTVSGMINSFDAIVAQLGKMNIVEAAAAGIGEALLTTALGLIIGIPAFMAFNYFTSVINRFVLDVEESATELMEVVTLHLALEERDGQEPPRGRQSALTAMPVAAQE